MSPQTRLTLVTLLMGLAGCAGNAADPAGPAEPVRQALTACPDGSGPLERPSKLFGYWTVGPADADLPAIAARGDSNVVVVNGVMGQQSRLDGELRLLAQSPVRLFLVNSIHPVDDLEPDGAGGYRLKVDAVSRWGSFEASMRPWLECGRVAGFMWDEPYWNTAGRACEHIPGEAEREACMIAKVQDAAFNEDARKRMNVIHDRYWQSFPNAVRAVQEVFYVLATNGNWNLPERTDWAGFTCYGTWTGGCGGMSVTTQFERLRAKLTSPSQRLFGAPPAYAQWWGGGTEADMRATLDAYSAYASNAQNGLIGLISFFYGEWPGLSGLKTLSQATRDHFQAVGKQFLAAVPVSDTSWKASPVAGSGWNTLPFDDSAWPNASSLGANGSGSWGTRPGISAAAHWIWTGSQNDGQVYLRRRFVASEASYKVSVTADDAFTLYVNGQQVLTGSGWQTTHTATFSVTPGSENVIAAHAVNAGTPSEWNPGAFIMSLEPGGAGLGTGLTAEYFDNMDFTGTKLTRVDATVDFDWQGGAPDASMGADQFSVRWTGKVEPRYSETYTFHTVSDDGVRLWVNGQLLIDNWTDHAPTENTGQISLEAGQKYELRMDFFENAGGAVAQLRWSSPSQSKELIPASRLWHGSTGPGIGTPVGGGHTRVDFDSASMRRTTLTGDWRAGSHKAECAPGERIVGVSKYTAPPYKGHGALCAQANPATHPHASCTTYVFANGDARGTTSTGEWAAGYHKGECAADEYMAGISQTPDGKLDAILCCKGAVAHNNCAAPIFLDTSARESTATGEWDPGYWKGECGPGRYAAGISRQMDAWWSGFSLLCCGP